MVEKKVLRDRLSAYVTPDTTKTIDLLREKYLSELGVKLTIGQAVDILVKQGMETK